MSTTTSKAVLESLEALLPTLTCTDEPGIKFYLRSDDREFMDDESQPPDSERGFDIWQHGGSAGPIHGHGEYQVSEQYLVIVAYPFSDSYRDLMIRVRNDVHTIKDAVDNPSNWAASVLHQMVKDWPPPHIMKDVGTVLQQIIIEVEYLEATTTTTA